MPCGASGPCSPTRKQLLPSHMPPMHNMYTTGMVLHFKTLYTAGAALAQHTSSSLVTSQATRPLHSMTAAACMHKTPMINKNHTFWDLYEYNSIPLTFAKRHGCHRHRCSNTRVHTFVCTMCLCQLRSSSRNITCQHLYIVQGRLRSEPHHSQGGATIRAIAYIPKARKLKTHNIHTIIHLAIHRCHCRHTCCGSHICIYCSVITPTPAHMPA